MIIRCRFHPVLTAVIQPFQEAGGIFDVFLRVESVFQTGKLLAVKAHVDLHAADVKIVDAAFAQRFCRGHGSFFGFVIMTFSAYVDGPRPSHFLLSGFVPFAGFHRRD